MKYMYYTILSLLLLAQNLVAMEALRELDEQENLYQQALDQAYANGDTERAEVIAIELSKGSHISRIERAGGSFTFLFRPRPPRKIDGLCISTPALDLLKCVTLLKDGADACHANSDGHKDCIRALPIDTNSMSPELVERISEETETEPGSFEATQETIYQMAFDQAIRNEDDMMADQILLERANRSSISYREEADGSFCFQFTPVDQTQPIDTIINDNNDPAHLG